MKNIDEKLVPLLIAGNCTPKIAQLAKQTGEPSTTLHYNIKKLEDNGSILLYKAVFDYKKIKMGFCSFVMIKLESGEYGNPEIVGKKLATFVEVESVDIITGEFEIIIKIRVSDQDEYYKFIKQVASIKGIAKTFSLVSFRQLKTEFTTMT